MPQGERLHTVPHLKALFSIFEPLLKMGMVARLHSSIPTCFINSQVAVYCKGICIYCIIQCPWSQDSYKNFPHFGTAVTVGAPSIIAVSNRKIPFNPKNAVTIQDWLRFRVRAGLLKFAI